MKNLKGTKIPLTVSTTDRAYKYVLANNAFSNGHYTALATALYVALRTRFITGTTGEVYLNVALGYHNFMNYNVVKNSFAKTGNGVDIGCMRFSQNDLHKIAKFVGFSKGDLCIYFPKMTRAKKAKAARAGR
jgi:hypothetical protein